MVPTLLREALILRDLEQLAMGGIASHLGISVPAARNGNGAFGSTATERAAPLSVEPARSRAVPVRCGVNRP